jgi:hypothetical protein
VPLLRVLTDRGSEYCGRVEQHDYQLYMAVNDIDHTRTKAQSPQTNGLCERFHTAERVERFLDHLETERGNGISTRNARLAALHTFGRHLGARQPEQLGRVQGVLNIPFKRGARQVSIEYPESSDIQALTSIGARLPGSVTTLSLL